MKEQDKAKGLRFRFQCVMLTVDGRPWIEGGEVCNRVAAATERAVGNRGGRLDSLEFHPDCIVFTYSSDGLEKPTSYMRAIRDEVKDEFGEEGPSTMGRAQFSRGYFSRKDYAIKTVGEPFEEGFATSYAERLRERCLERERSKRTAKDARRREEGAEEAVEEAEGEQGE